MRNNLAENTTSYRVSRERAGFTLLELLVAITILCIVVAIVYEAFVSVTDASALARENAEQLRFQQFLWRTISTDLTSIYSDPGCEQPEYQLLGTDQDGAYGPADSLRFCTALEMSGPSALPGILKVVTYELSNEYTAEGGPGLGRFTIDENPAEERTEQQLVIREEPLTLQGMDMNGKMKDIGEPGRELKVPIQSMDIEYYDGDLEEWVAEWDSVAKTRLPWAVRVKINFARSQEEADADARSGIDLQKSPDLDMTIALPPGMGVLDQFIEPNHRRTSESPDGLSDAT